MKKSIKTVDCGDWHLGWGYGGHDKIGKLSVDDNGVFTWSGNSQGRHGSTWNRGAKLIFESNGMEITKIIEQVGSAPVQKVLLNCVNKLKF